MFTIRCFVPWNLPILCMWSVLNRSNSLIWCTYPLSPRSHLGQSEPGSPNLHRVFWDPQKLGDPPVPRSLTRPRWPAARAHIGSQRDWQPHGEQYLGGTDTGSPKTDSWCYPVRAMMCIKIQRLWGSAKCCHGRCWEALTEDKWMKMFMYSLIIHLLPVVCFLCQRGTGVMDQSQIRAEALCGVVASSHSDWRSRHYAGWPSTVGSDGTQPPETVTAFGPLHQGGH